jgi:hypothetical protein
MTQVSDFGLSRPLMESEYYKTGDSSRGHIPVKWTAPEALKWLKYSSQSGNIACASPPPHNRYNAHTTRTHDTHHCCAAAWYTHHPPRVVS